MENVSKLVHQVLSKGKKPIVYDLFWHSQLKKQPLIIFAHGYKGFKDWGGWNLMAENLAIQGIALLKFNFSHNGGTVDQPVDFPDLEAFGANTYSQEIKDLQLILEMVQQDWGRKYDFIDYNRITLMGHSRGGAIASYVATQSPYIQKLITLASVSSWDRPFQLNDEELKEWKETNVRHVLNQRTHQLLPHFYSFYEDYIAHHHLWDLKKAFAKRSIPHLILHGANDESVDFNEAELLHSWNSGSSLHKISWTGHTFGMQHPWEEQQLPAPMLQVIHEVVQFIKS